MVLCFETWVTPFGCCCLLNATLRVREGRMLCVEFRVKCAQLTLSHVDITELET